VFDDVIEREREREGEREGRKDEMERDLVTSHLTALS
jgi:hypothetical protein